MQNLSPSDVFFQDLVSAP